MVPMHNAGHRVDLVVGQVLHVVELGELTTRPRHLEALELLERLLAQVSPVDQEKDPLGLAVSNEPLADVRRGERFARAGGHLDQCPGVVVLQRPLQIRDRLELRVPQPGRIMLEDWHGRDTRSQRAAAGVDVVLQLPFERL